MDTETLKTLCSGIKGYAIILTNILDEKVQDFEYIIDSKYLSIASFSLVSCVLLAIKEDVVEGTKERLQAFEGVVIAKRHGGISETFTVRRLSFGIGVERTFPVHSPKIDRIEVIKKGKVRRAKLYHLRDLTGKAAKVEEIL